MKWNPAIISLLFSSLLLAGCNKDSSTERQIDKVQAKTEQAVRDMKNYTYAQKAQFVDAMQNQIADLNHEMDALTLKVEKSSAEAKAEAQPKLRALREKIEG